MLFTDYKNKDTENIYQYSKVCMSISTILKSREYSRVVRTVHLIMYKFQI